MRKAFQVLLLVMVFSLCLTLPAWAENWKNPKDYPAPPAYAGREYTRQHYTEFRYDEGNGPQGPLFTGWCSVFDLPPEYNQGYTAVGPKDEAWSKANDWLPYLGVPKSGGYFIVSPAYWGTQGAIPVSTGEFIPSPMVPDANNSEQMWLGVAKVQDSSGLVLGIDTIDNPKCFNNGPPGQGFEAGGYQHIWGNQYRGWHWYPLRSDLSKAPVAVTRKYATKMWGSQQTTWAKLCYKYLYNITCSGVKPVGLSQNTGGKDKYTAYFFNTTPFLAKDVTLRAYIVQNGKYTLVAQTTTEIGPLPIGMVSPQGTPRYGSGVTAGGTANAITWTFEAPVPTGNYKLLVSANLAFAENGMKLPEPLTTRTAYGSWGAMLPPLTGTKYEVKPLLTRRGSNPYDDN